VKNRHLDDEILDKLQDEDAAKLENPTLDGKRMGRMIRRMKTRVKVPCSLDYL